METRLLKLLAPVRRRLGIARGERWATAGLAASALAGMVVGAWRLASGSGIPWWGIALVGSLPLAGFLFGFCTRRSWESAASAVDQTYRLKDRIATALDFVRRPDAGPLHRLEIRDAAEYLAAVDPKRVVPARFPPRLDLASGLAVLAAALVFWPLGPDPSQAALAPPPDVVVAEADTILEDLKQLDELAEEDQDQELKDLVAKLQEQAEAMKEPGVDLREALAKLSEMETAIQAQQAQYNVGLVDGQLAALGEAMMASPALEGTGRALSESKYEKAAEQMEALEDVENLPRQERKGAAEKMKAVADKMGEVGLGQMSQAVGDMTEGLSSGKSHKYRMGTSVLAKAVRSQGKRRRANQLLMSQLSNLNECKCNCEKNSLTRGKNPRKSTSPSQNFGLGTSGNVIGEKTDYLAQRRQEQITGQQGEGESEVETTHSPEGREQAKRGYRETYNKYKKLSDEVLETEPIPLGHRETIRKYFELIRPRSGEGDAGDTVPAPAPASAPGEAR